MAEYASLSKKVTHLYTLREMVLPEDELKIYNETIDLRLEDTKPTIEKVDKQMETGHRPQHEKSTRTSKRVQELAKENS